MRLDRIGDVVKWIGFVFVLECLSFWLEVDVDVDGGVGNLC